MLCFPYWYRELVLSLEGVRVGKNFLMGGSHGPLKLRNMAFCGPLKNNKIYLIWTHLLYNILINPVWVPGYKNLDPGFDLSVVKGGEKIGGP